MQFFFSSFDIDVFIGWMYVIPQNPVTGSFFFFASLFYNFFFILNLVGAGATEAVIVNPFEVVKVTLQSNTAK